MLVHPRLSLWLPRGKVVTLGQQPLRCWKFVQMRQERFVKGLERGRFAREVQATTIKDRCIVVCFWL